MCDTCEWPEALEELNDLCEDSDYDFANDTLSGIADLDKRDKHVTIKQLGAIANSERAVEDR